MEANERRSADREVHTTDHSRRAFLAYASALLSVLIGVVLAVPLIGFVLAPVFQRRRTRWVKLGDVSKLRRGVPTKFTYSYPTTDAWLSKVARGTVYVLTDDGRTYTVLSNVCTHAGCGVRWDPDQKAFQCPCHNGRFTKTGKVLSGPPPRPLRRFSHKLAGTTLLVELGGKV